MYMEMYAFKQGNFKFTVELDTGAELGENQLTLRYSEKKDAESILLKEIQTPLLRKALKEPYRTQFNTILQEMKSSQTEAMEQEIKQLQQPFLASAEAQPVQKQKMPGKVKRQIKQLRRKVQRKIEQLESSASRNEIVNLGRDCFDTSILVEGCEQYQEDRFLRNFYFEDATKRYIKDFCHKFALEPEYRQKVLNGETRWSQRDALFQRNLTSVIGEATLLSDDKSAVNEAREFFRWLDLYAEVILTHPDYQRLLTLDRVEPEHRCRHDPSIQAAIELFEQLPGVQVLRACQGVSGKVHWHEEGRPPSQCYGIMVVTPHAEYAHVIFSSLDQFVHDTILAYLPAYPAITTERIPCEFAIGCTLRATGNNQRFRSELLKLAHDVYRSWLKSGQGRREAECGTERASQTVKTWTPILYPASRPVTDELGGLLSGRRRWLCQPPQLERTLELLYHLNHWAKASDQLFYNDRQGLYSIKAVLLQECFEQGRIVASGYIDGSQIFVKNIDSDMIADFASETAMFWLEEEAENMQEDIAHKLYRRMLDERGLEESKERCITDITAGERKKIEEWTKEMIQHALDQMIERACQSRQPLDTNALAELCILPSDILNTDPFHSSSEWDKLSPDDLRQLDPEGWSLISFQYRSPQESAQQSESGYTFHLPYQIAKSFIGDSELAMLREQHPLPREEEGSWGRAINEEESQLFPLERILQELQCNVQRLCPKGLERKHIGNRYYVPSYYNDYDGYDDDGDDDDELERIQEEEIQIQQGKEQGKEQE